MAVPTLIGWQYFSDVGPTVDAEPTFGLNNSPFVGTVAGDFCTITVLVYSPAGFPTVEMGDFSGGGWTPSSEWDYEFMQVQNDDFYSLTMSVVLTPTTLASFGHVGFRLDGIGSNDRWDAFCTTWHDAVSLGTVDSAPVGGSTSYSAPAVGSASDAVQLAFAFTRDTGEADPSIPDNTPASGLTLSQELSNYQFESGDVYYYLNLMADDSATMGIESVEASTLGIFVSFMVEAVYEGPPEEPPVFRSFFAAPQAQRPLGWQYILCHTPDPTDPTGELEEIGELESGRGKTLELVRNRPGAASVTLSIHDEMAQFIFDKLDLGDVRGSLRKTLLVRRNRKDIWSGPIGSLSGTLTEGGSAVTLNAVGWMEYLFHRELSSDVTYTSQNQAAIAFALLERVNTQDPGHPSPVFAGSVLGFMPSRTVTFKKGDTFGASIQKLSDVESGFDFDIHPRTREMNIYAWNAYKIRKNVKLGLGWGPDNIQKMEWNENGLATRNSLIVSGSTGIPISAQSDTSQDEYGVFHETINLPGASAGILPDYANAELAIKQVPQVTYNLTPKEKTEEDDGAPRLFEDFFIGEQIAFTAKDGYFEVKNQGIRLFGASLSISDDGNREQINSLMISPAS